jgi:hypothetical protein
MDTTHIVAAKITLDDLVNIPKIMKNTIMLNSNTDPLLEFKYLKCKLFKSYFHEKTDINIAKINALDKRAIKELIQHRDKIARNNHLKNSM